MAESRTADEVVDELRKCRAEIKAGKDASARAKEIIREAHDGNLVDVAALAAAFEVSPGMIYQYVAPAMRDD